MKPHLAITVSLLLVASFVVSCAMNVKPTPSERPIVIAHRGASGYAPEHTLVAYFIAIQQGADFIEPDLVSTKDGVLVARHENDITGTTDVADRPEFARRKTTKTIDGTAVTGWFTEDFTLAELKTLRARERLPSLRASNTRLDRQLEVPTLEEVLSLVQQMNLFREQNALRLGLPRPAPIGVYPETKHPSYFARLGLAMETPLVEILRHWGYRDPRSPVFIQSFEVANLRFLNTITELPLIQLMDTEGAPYDFVVAGDPRKYTDMITASGLQEIATYADGIGVNKSLIIPRRADSSLGEPTTLVRDAHAAGLLVHAWTFRAENFFLPLEYRVGTAPEAIGELPAEIRRFLDAGIDGFFADHPDLGVTSQQTPSRP